MCGIFGYNWQDPNLARKMAQLLRHRGPDESQVLNLGNGTIGVERLAITDRIGSRQPLSSTDSHFVLAYNGEVYNYQELADELKDLGHHFVTRGDTEVVLHGYEEWGAGVLRKLNGMFAFAIVDRDARAWFLARDPFGIKPLYYSRHEEQFAFASEIKPLLEIPWVRRSARKDLLRDFILEGTLPEDQEPTLFAD